MKSLNSYIIVLSLLLSSAVSMFAGGANEGAAVDMEQFVEVTHHVMGNAPTNGMDKIVEEEWNKLLEESINTHMVLKWIEWADWYTKYNLLLASGEPVDLIHSSSTWLDLWPNSQKGAFLPLDDYLPEYAPKTWSEIPSEDWDQIRYEGKIMGFPENNYSQYVNHGFYYRGDWAREFGINEHIDSYEKLEEYFQGIVDNKPNVIPWDVNNGTNWVLHGWFQTKSDKILANLPTKYQIFMGESFEDPYTLVPIIYEDLFIDFAYKMKDWYDRGFWRRDVLNYTSDTRDALKAEKSGSDQHHSQTFRFLRKEMDELFPGSELQMFAFADTRGNLVAEPITHGATSVGRNSDSPERAIMVYEELRQNEEFYHLVNYGLEGVQYNIVDGVRVRPEGFDRELHEFTSNYWGGRVDKFEIPSDTEWSGIWEIWEDYDRIIKKPFPYSKFILDKTPIEAELAAISDVIGQYLVPILYGVVDDPREAVMELREAMEKAGHDRLLSEIQRQLTDHKNSL